MESQMTNDQLRIYVYHTCQWWNAVFVQGRRFLDAFEKEQGVDPWTEEGQTRIFVPERMFFISAIFHAIEGLEKLDLELRRTNDYTFSTVLEKIRSVVPWEDIKALRNMNEHSASYLVNEGFKQNEFIRTYRKDEHKVQIPANWTYLNGNNDTFLLGNVPVDKLIAVMKEQNDVVRNKAKEIFYHSYI